MTNVYPKAMRRRRAERGMKKGEESCVEPALVRNGACSALFDIPDYILGPIKSA